MKCHTHIKSLLSDGIVDIISLNLYSNYLDAWPAAVARDNKGSRSSLRGGDQKGSASGQSLAVYRSI